VVVLTLASLEGESLEDLSLSIAHDRWRLGQKGKDNGVLFTVAMKEKKYRFEIGYGLEGALPDSRVGSIGRELLVPYFRQNDYSRAIGLTALAVAQAIAEDSGVALSGMPQARPGEPRLPFFNKPAKTNTSLAAFWQRYPAPIVPGYCRRVAVEKFVVEFLHTGDAVLVEYSIWFELLLHFTPFSRVWIWLFRVMPYLGRRYNLVGRKLARAVGAQPPLRKLAVVTLS